MTVDEMRQRRRELGYTYAMLSERSGVPVATIQKMFSGTTASPRRDTITALERALKKKTVYSFSDDMTSLEIKEKIFSYGKRVNSHRRTLNNSRKRTGAN